MRIKVIPRAGFTVRDPVSMQALPPEGATVESGSFWTRRQRDGDVTIKPADEPAAAEKPAAAAKK